jgi:hypothetical protein
MPSTTVRPHPSLRHTVEVTCCLALEHVDAEIDVVDDAEFELDMRVVRTASRLRATATFTDLSDGLAGHTVTTRYVELVGATKPAGIAETVVVVS